VHRAEDVTVAQAVAASVGFQPINGLRLSGVQQVQLDVVIARVRRTKGRNFGFNFLLNTRQTLVGSGIGGLLPTLSQGVVGVPGTVLQPTQFGQINAIAPGNANLFGGVIGNAAGFQAFLQALETEGIVKVLAQPRLVTLSGNPASFLDGGEQAVPVPAGLGQVGVQFNEFGTRLNFLPIVLGNGRIHLEVEPEVSFLDATAGTAIQGTVVAGRATQRVHTTVELESGQTFVIGGIIQKVNNGTTNKVPVIGQLPFVGALFSTKTFLEDEAELVVMVTPHLVDAQSSDQVCKSLPGQESRVPDDFELFLEGILEAPRGPRAVFIHGRYVPAHRNGPTAELYPCAGRSDGIGRGGAGCGNGACGNGACGNGACGNGTGTYLPANHTPPGVAHTTPGRMPLAGPADGPMSRATPAAEQAPGAPALPGREDPRPTGSVPAESPEARPADPIKAPEALPPPATNSPPAPSLPMPGGSDRP
jgi:pilus assembly protein CpaC